MIWFLLLVLLCMPLFAPAASLFVMGLIGAVWMGFDLTAALVLTIGIGAVLMYMKSISKAG